jgi:lysophospholipase L1-like esterase
VAARSAAADARRDTDAHGTRAGTRTATAPHKPICLTAFNDGTSHGTKPAKSPSPPAPNCVSWNFAPQPLSSDAGGREDGEVMRNLINHLGLIALGVFLAGLGVEIALRVSDAVPEVGSPLSAFYQSDSYLGWSGQPNQHLRYRRPEFDTMVQLDADGWRQPEPPRPARPVHRLLVLGDSFTWGWGVSQGQVFTDLLQAALPATVAVYNRGVVGFGTGQEYLLLQREFAARAYDAVVLMFFINDLADNIDGKEGHRPYFEVVDGHLHPRNQPAVAQNSPVEQFLKEHSRAYRFVDFEVGMLKRRFAGEAADERGYREAAAVDFHDLPGYAVTARLLGAIRRLTCEHGARFLLVYIPQRSEFEADAPLPYVRSVHAMIDDIARREGIPLLDLSPRFQQQAKAGKQLIYAVDAHWTPAGHRLAADVLLAAPILEVLRDAAANEARDTEQTGDCR